MSQSSPVGQYLVKPATVAAAGAAITHIMYPAATMDVLGKNTRLSLALAGTIFAGSLVGEFLHDKAFPLLGPTNRLTQPLAEAVTVGAATGTSAMLLSLNNNDSLSDIGMPWLLATVAGAEVIGDYVFSNFLAPMVLGEEHH